MQRITLADGPRTTTQLGFGCAYINPDNAGVLDAAYDAGIRHFDVGRSYGRGLTEGIIGRFLRRRAAEVSLTGKYGITPPFSNPLHEVARLVLRPAVKYLRRSRRIDQRLDAVAGIANRKAKFTAAEARSALQVSLRNIGVDRLDFFLMHEADADDLADPELLDVLRAAVNSGRIGAFGVAGAAARLGRLQAERADYCRVLQYDWTPLQSVPTAESFSILFRVFGACGGLKNAMAAQPALRRQWCDAVGMDLTAPGVLERLMLSATIARQPRALVLFSSSRAEHIDANVRAASDAALAAAGLRLIELAQNGPLAGAA